MPPARHRSDYHRARHGSDAEPLTAEEAAEERLLLALRTTEGAPADLLSALDLSLAWHPRSEHDAGLRWLREQVVAGSCGMPQ